MICCLWYSLKVWINFDNVSGNWDPSRYGVDEIMKATVVILELAVLEQRAQILGGVCIFDLGGLSLSHAWHVTPTLAAKVVNLLGVCKIYAQISCA